MPVPAFRNSRSRVRRRRSHHALKAIRVTIDKETGEMVLPHHGAVKAASAKETTKKAKNVSSKKTKAHDHDHDHEGHDHAGHSHA